jgi:hypothetical protein
VVLVLGSLEQMELDETWDLGQLGVAAQPHPLEGLFGASLSRGIGSWQMNIILLLVQIIGGVPATRVIASRLATGTTVLACGVT